MLFTYAESEIPYNTIYVNIIITTQDNGHNTNFYVIYMWYNIVGNCIPNICTNPEILYAHALEAAAIPIKVIKETV